MNFKEILELIDKVSEKGIAELEIEQAGTKLRIQGKPSQPPVLHSYAAELSRETPAPVSASPQPGAASQIEASEEAGLHIITSPIVGTFFRAPNPESDPFVMIGDQVSRGKVLCIIEAMKLMNEIESDIDGEVVRIYPQNGQPVEYGERLFAVRT